MFGKTESEKKNDNETHKQKIIITQTGKQTNWVKE
jgi:hypothetical protein